MHQNKPKGAGPVKKAGGHFHESTRGCLGGISFCFISHVGQVQPCGYLELNCGNVQQQSFADIWENSEVFRNLRDYGKYSGKCGRCEFIKVCGGCRARAYEATGDYLGRGTVVSVSTRLLKNVHLRRCASSFVIATYAKIRLIPQGLARLASRHF